MNDQEMTEKERKESFERFIERMTYVAPVIVLQCNGCIYQKDHGEYTMFGCVKRDPNKQPPDEILNNVVKCEFRKTK